MEKTLQQVFASDKIVIKDGWALCPVCHKGKIIRVLPSTTVHELPCYCKKCGQHPIISIEAPEPESKETSA